MGKLQYFSTTRMQGGCVPEVHPTKAQRAPFHTGTVLRLLQTRWAFLLLGVPFSIPPQLNFRQKYAFFYIII